MKTRFRITKEMTVIFLAGFVIMLGLSMTSLAQNNTTDDTPAAKNQSKQYVHIQILGVNDFHGQLDTKKKIKDRFAGGADYLSAYLKQRKTENANTLIIHAGDMVGGSSPTSSLFQDEPTIEFMNLVGFDVGIPGNHELDEGYSEMMRLINGGYHTATGNFTGADFPYISANMINTATRTPVLDPYVVKNVDGIPIAFIGVTLTDKHVYQNPEGLNAIEFTDETIAINKAAAELKDQNVEAIILLAHVDASLDKNTQKVSGKIAEIADNIDDEIDVIFAGHNHNYLNNYLDGKLIVESYCNGTAFSDVDLEIDPQTNDIVTKQAEIVITYHDSIEADAEITELTASYDKKVNQLVNETISVSDNLITKKQNNSGEAPLGNLIADAQRWKLKTDFAFINSPGIRADIEKGTVTWGELYNVQPFHNNLVKITLSGQQIRELLNQQFQVNKMLQISGLKYTWRNDAVVDILLDDGITPMDPSANYTVAVNSFLVAGGDGFTVFQEGEDHEIKSIDFESLIDYLKQIPQPFSASIEGRISEI